MRLHLNAARIGLMAASFAALGISAAAQGASPIQIVSCQIKTTAGNQGYALTQTLWVDYRNTGKVAATAVVFNVALPSGIAGTITDKGTFAPGAEIKHQLFSYPVPQGTSGTAATKPSVCEAKSVQFADGTKWVKH